MTPSAAVTAATTTARQWLRWFGMRCLGAGTIAPWMPFLGSPVMFLVRKVGLPATPNHALVLGLVPATSLSSDDSQTEERPPSLNMGRQECAGN